MGHRPLREFCATVPLGLRDLLLFCSKRFASSTHNLSPDQTHAHGPLTSQSALIAKKLAQKEEALDIASRESEALGRELESKVRGQTSFVLLCGRE